MVRNLFLHKDLQETLNRVAGLARDILGSDAVGVVLVQHEAMTTAAATEAAVHHAGALQLACSEGPSVDAIVERRHSVVDDLRLERRWRFWAPQAAQLGWRSVMSVSLADENTLGALSLYSRRPQAFTAAHLGTAEEYAQHAALALAISHERAHLLHAVDNRTLIGQAQGVLMQRYNIDADQAITVLRRYSSHTNRKLRHIAQDIVRDRCLPEQPIAGPR